VAERAPSGDDHAEIGHRRAVVETVAPQWALDRLPARDGDERLRDGRSRPGLADHSDRTGAAATRAELNGDGILELPHLDERREVIVVERQAPALILGEQEGVEAEVARPL